MNIKIESLMKELKDNSQANMRQEGVMNDIVTITRDLASIIQTKLNIRKSRIKLDYIKADGSVVAYNKQQEITCNSNEPITETFENIFILAGGEITEIYAGDNMAIINKIFPHKVDIRIPFNPPLTLNADPYKKNIRCQFINAFIADKEWFEVSQLNNCDEEIFEISFLKERPCKKKYIENLDINGFAIETSTENFKYSSTSERYNYLISIPPQTPPYRYRILWEF